MKKKAIYFLFSIIILLLSTCAMPEVSDDEYQKPIYNNSKIYKWFYSAGNNITSPPAIDNNGIIYVGSYDEKLYAINPDGTLKWSYAANGSISSSPVLGKDGTVYAGSFDGKLYAINPDGTKKWTFTTGFWIFSSPAIGSDGTIYAGSFDKKFYAIYPDGTFKWSFTTGDLISSSPAIGSNDIIYFGSYDKKLYAINPDGTKKWEFISGGHISSGPVIAGDGTVLFGCDDFKLYAINPDGTLKWSYNLGNYLSGPVISGDGVIFLGCSDSNLYAINPNGTFKWLYKTSTSITSSPAVSSVGTVFVRNCGGNRIGNTVYPSILYEINPDGSLKSSYSIADLESSPAIGSDGTVYIGAKNSFYAIPTNCGGSANAGWPSIHRNIQNTGNVNQSGTIIAMPTYSPNGGTYNFSQNVAISTGLSGAEIRYTLDGSTPTSVYGIIYTGSINVTTTATIIKAIAYKSGYIDSSVSLAAYTIKVETPIFSLAAGTYAAPQDISITTATSDAEIKYTIDGTTPTSSHGTIYSGPINVSGKTTIKAIAYKSGWTDSSITSAAYIIKAATPVFSPASGTYAAPQDISITTATSDAEIRYTIDGTTPTSSYGTIYSGPINVSDTITIKAIAYKSGFTNSNVASALYTFIKTIEFQDDGNGFQQFYTNDSQYYNYFFIQPYNPLLSPMTEVEVDIKKNSGNSNMGYGIVFHCQDTDNFYRILITTTGYYNIYKKISGSYAVIKDWTTSSNLITGYNKINNIKITRDIAGNFKIYFNEVEETSAGFTDISITSGYSGFYAAVSSSENFPNTAVDLRYKSIKSQ